MQSLKIAKLLLFNSFNWEFEPNQVLQKIDSFNKLQDGWNYGRGCAPSSYVQATAKELVSSALSFGLDKIDVFPGTDGEVIVSIYCGEDDHSFQVNTNSSINYWIENDPNTDFHENLSMRDVLEKIKKLKSWKSSDTSTSNIGTEQRATSKAQPSQTPAMAQEFPALITPARYQPLAVCVSTQENFIPQQVPNPLFFGSFQTPFYLRNMP